MNAYMIEGREYIALNEYDAVKQAYKMADRIELGSCIGNDTWNYMAIFRSGKATVTVRRVERNGMSDTWVTIPATAPLPEEDRILATWYFRFNQWFCFNGDKFQGRPDAIADTEI